MLRFQRAGVPFAIALRLLAALCLFALAVQAQAQSAAEGQAAFARGGYTQAERIWRPLAERGVADAQVGLGKLYATGRGVAQDVAAAVRWYRRAAEQGSAAAQSSLGFLPESGRGGPKDDAHRKAAVQGNAAALTNLASMADEGRGVAQDWILAAALFARAAAVAPTQQDIVSLAGGQLGDGQRRAHHAVGRLFRCDSAGHGRPVTRHPAEAARVAKRSSAPGAAMHLVALAPDVRYGGVLAAARPRAP